ncbi:MAG: hypothetical protein ACXVHB_31880 [Solirubrobacteraceae bacterium]
MELRRRQLTTRFEEARRAEGVSKVALLRRAAQFAHANGLSVEAAAMLKELRIPHSELGLEVFEVSEQIPTEDVREEVDRLAGTGAKDVFDALRRIGAGVEPPGGSNARQAGRRRQLRRRDLADIG